MATSNIMKISQTWLFSQATMTKAVITDTKTTKSVSFSIPETIYNVVMDGNSVMYISGMNYLYKYTVGNYPQTKSFYFSEDAKKFNPNQDIIMACGKNDILSAQTYNGSVVLRNKDTMEQVKTHNGIDSPLKASWSDYHNAYIVMGANGIWKITNTEADLVFSVDGYALKDIAVDQNGHIGIVLSSKAENKDIIKVLGNDFYKNLLSPYFDYGTVKNIIWAGNVFYAIQELPSTDGKYKGNGILVNPKTKTYEAISIQATVKTAPGTTPTTTTATIDIIYPSEGVTLATGSEYELKWISSKGASENVKIELIRDGETALVIADKTENSGNYKWKVPSSVELSTGYTLKITWLTTAQSDSNSDLSGNFIISDTEPPPETADGADNISGISYDKFTNSVILSFYSGLVSAHDLTARQFYGLYVSGLVGVNGNVANNDQIKQFDDVSKVRIFVGTDRYLNDKWDSGEVETKLTSMYYGGGKNLEPGKTYYVHIQVYSEKFGWSEMQIKQFTMPL